ncbi:hypothetical protein [Glutamicibacter sp. NPDC127525]
MAITGEIADWSLGDQANALRRADRGCTVHAFEATCWHPLAL